MPRICSVPGCNGRGGFLFPVSKDLRQRWVEALNITHLPAKTIERSTICPRHFAKNDYVSSGENFYTGLPVVRKRLKSNAVPSVDLILNSNDEIENEDPDESSSNAAAASLQDHDYNVKGVDENLKAELSNFIMVESTSAEDAGSFQNLESNVISIEINDESINKILEFYNLEEEKLNNSQTVDGFSEETVVVKLEDPDENFMIQNHVEMEVDSTENNTNSGVENIKIENVFCTKPLTGGRVCCVKGCENTIRNICKKNSVKFYNFPTDKLAWRNERRQKWIEAVIKQNNFSSDWQPKKYATICSAHFVGGKKSEHPKHPGYNPTIFPKTLEKVGKLVKVEKPVHIVKNEQVIRNLPSIHQARTINTSVSNKMIKKISDLPRLVAKKTETLIEPVFVEVKNFCEVENFQCQVDFLNFKPLNNIRLNTMVCTRKFENKLHCAGTQTFIQKDPLKGGPKPKIIQNIQLIPPYKKKKTVPEVTETNNQGCVKNIILPQGNLFEGIKYCGIINSDNDLKCMCGVTFEIFNNILRNLPPAPDPHFSNTNRLLIFLMKLKLGINNSSLSVLFNQHQETISRIFEEILCVLVDYFKNKVVWPSKEAVHKTVPEVFKNTYSKCKAIVDYIEIPMEVPEKQYDELLFYSTYKNCLSFKAVVAYAPNGFVIFKSKCYYGQQNDQDIMRECELFSCINCGDVILADKDFPSIKNAVEFKGAFFKVPPLVQNVQPTSVHIHIKQCINRVKFFKILTGVPVELFSKIDDIIYVCCSIVNLQTPLS